jgi:hypothetical protein
MTLFANIPYRILYIYNKIAQRYHEDPVLPHVIRNEVYIIVRTYRT